MLLCLKYLQYTVPPANAPTFYTFPYTFAPVEALFVQMFWLRHVCFVPTARWLTSCITKADLSCPDKEVIVFPIIQF